MHKHPLTTSERQGEVYHMATIDNALKNLTGQEFGIWKVLEQAPRRDNKTRWLCECTVCGARRSKRSTTLRASQYAECDGRHLEKIRTPSPLKKASGHAAATERYAHYRGQAQQRGFAFTLSREAFMHITQEPCHYCAAPPSNTFSRRHFNGAFVYNGLDRKDSQRGYEEENCLPCCSTCNVMKQDLPYEAFLGHIAQILIIHPGVVPLSATRQMSLGKGGNALLANLDTSAPMRTWEERCAVVAPLLEAGKTTEEIAEILNLSRGSVYRTIIRLRQLTQEDSPNDVSHV